MWGKLTTDASSLLAGRFIPTHVGKAGAGPRDRPHRAVHPHACGESVRLEDMSLPDPGSSPRMWGKFLVDGLLDLPRRFIPTHVGKATYTTSAVYSPPVHPHACGESVRVSIRACLSRRFIPTHVGKACSIGWRPIRPPVHPHACGESVARKLREDQKVGSSPRMWGKRVQINSVGMDHRFIPTHVGKADIDLLRITPAAVHPHACGESLAWVGVILRSNGSSPRMWGKLPLPDRDLPSRRFIPTHVGKARPLRPPAAPLSVHPHACGESPCNVGAEGGFVQCWGPVGVESRYGCVLWLIERTMEVPHSVPDTTRPPLSLPVRPLYVRPFCTSTSPWL